MNEFQWKTHSEVGHFLNLFFKERQDGEQGDLKK